jgi:hypothetical protein
VWGAHSLSSRKLSRPRHSSSPLVRCRQKSSKFITGSGTGSGALPVAFDYVVDERVWLVMVAVVRRGDVSSSPASYFSNSFLLGALSRNPLLLPPPEYFVFGYQRGSYKKAAKNAPRSYPLALDPYSPCSFQASHSQTLSTLLANLLDIGKKLDELFCAIPHWREKEKYSGGGRLRVWETLPLIPRSLPFSSM